MDATPEAVRARVSRGLSMFVGTGRAYATRLVADGTGIPVPTLKDYRAGAIEMPVSRFVALCAALPEGFADQVLALAGLAVVAREGQRASDSHALAADTATALQRLTEALRDGRIDHVEGAALAPTAREVGQALLAFAERYASERNAQAKGTGA